MKQGLIVLGTLAFVWAGCSGSKSENSNSIDEDNDGVPQSKDCDDKDPEVQLCDIGQVCVSDEQCESGVCAQEKCACSEPLYTGDDCDQCVNPVKDPLLGCDKDIVDDTSPVIQVSPTKIQFGGKLVGQESQIPVEISNVGTAELEVYSITMTDDSNSNSNFGLDYSTLPGFEGNSAPSQSNPLVLAVNGNTQFKVTYVPSVENPVGDDGQPIFDQGTLLIESNAPENQVEIEVTGVGVIKDCPTAVLVVQEGEQVIPQTNLHLLGDQSFAPAGAVADWKWTVEQPNGSNSLFVPSDEFPNPTFEVNVAGKYVFSLDVWDQAGAKSCSSFEQSVIVVPDEAIHVELVWHTPGDPDETDEGPKAGTDMDLHFADNSKTWSGNPDLDKDGLPDPWFDKPYDCFWFNAHPNWGNLDPSVDDDPGLDRDDTDGAGPENLNLNIPENTTYRVGVHYWDEKGYGASVATLRVYIYSQLVWEQQGVTMKKHDMWDAVRIEWPAATVSELKAADGGKKITPDYKNPFFSQP